jgi:GH25 family lysozyme M1 (1,4-beta-N-acetylmuramidase)
VKNGIDVSKWQGVIDWKSVKADFCIIRAGIGTAKDVKFEANYAGCKSAGIPCGAYWFLKALTPDEARREAAACISVLSGKCFEYPIYADIELNVQFKLGRDACTDIADAFCSVLEKAGYFVGIYSSKSHLENYFTESIRQRYAVWVAHYAKSTSYKGAGMWQKSDKWSCKGITGNVDLDECYIDYPAIIKAAGKNGFTAAEKKPTADTVPEPPESLLLPVSEVARQVIGGEWGNGTERVQRLTAVGYDYKAVQAEVNRQLATHSSRTHTVRRGDTLSALAKRYGTTVSAIVAANRAKYPRIKPSYICVGWILKV